MNNQLINEMFWIFSCLQDATWVAPTKTLKCTCLEEVYLLLKSSDRISGDINAVKEFSTHDQTISPCLVLKKWRDINPCTEFRCFVVHKELIGNKLWWIHFLFTALMVNIKIYLFINIFISELIFVCDKEFVKEMARSIINILSQRNIVFERILRVYSWNE